MADVRGSNVRIVAVPETTYKTPGANGALIYFTSFGVVPDQGINHPRQVWIATLRAEYPIFRS